MTSGIAGIDTRVPERVEVVDRARGPAPTSRRSAARIAACSQACASPTAAASGRPRARPAAIAEESVQPVPWVFDVAMRAASKRSVPLAR